MSKSYNAIISAMAKGPSKTLVAEMETYCRQNSLDVFETFFESDDLLPRIKNAWEADEEFMRWLLDRLTAAAKAAADAAARPEGRVWFEKGQAREEIVRQSVEVVAENFISVRDGSSQLGAYTDYRIVDRSRGIVEPLMVGDDRPRDIARTLSPIIAKDGYQISLTEAKTIWDFASVHGRVEAGKPKLCAQPDDSGWCLHRISIVADGSSGMPTTQAFLDRINDPEAFAAYCYGVASGRYVGRQILWLHGSGSDGKSTFFKAYASIFGLTAGSIDWTTLKDNASFAGSLFVNKRFVYIPDNNNPELLNSGLFKSLSDPGSDPVTINHKYGKMYSTELEAHTAVLSNFEPAIRNQMHSLSRALYLKIKPRDTSIPADKSITDRFIAELPAFLTYGRECYDRVCLNNTEIRINDAARDAINDRIDSSSEKFHVAMNKLFVLDPKSDITGGEVFELLTDERFNPREVGDFRTWVLNEYDVLWKKRAGQRIYAGMRKRTSADDAKAIMAAADMQGAF